MIRTSLGIAVLGLGSLVCCACSGDDSESAQSSGGASGSGAAPASTGGSPAAGTGGQSAAGSTSSGGSSTAAGGVSSAGGVHSPGGSGGGTAPGTNCSSAAADSCPLATGLPYACKQRFALGVNYAWRNFGADFGGVPAWSMKGVSGDPTGYDSDLANMRANGVSVVRWWVFPDFRGNGVTFDANGDPSGLSGTAVADVQKALELANKNDLSLVLTIFSFDNFKPDQALGAAKDVQVRSITPIVTDSARRAKLVSNVVRPLAKAVATSPHASRLLGWDIINEPEWAVTKTAGAPSGGDFDPNTTLTPISLADMKSLISESAAALKQETPNALTSVGWAAAKWQWAFSDVVLDFNQPHIYGWVNEWWPYTKSPSDLGYKGKPTVMGEFFLADMPFDDPATSGKVEFDTPFATIVDSFYSNGYAGAWAWPADASALQTKLPLIKTFKDAKGCSAGY